MVRERLDVLLVTRGLAPTREKARRLAMAGKVWVDGRRVDKPGQAIDPDSPLEVRGEEQYASRGGLKLVAALDHFGVDPAGLVAMDVGASTGGFTDVLLRRGASRVWAVDVGHGLMDERLRRDSRVVLVERTNIRYLEKERIPEPVDMATVDTSFISLRLVLPKVAGFVKPGGLILALVKPQFELGPREVGKGVVRDPARRKLAVAGVAEAARSIGLEVRGVFESPVTGAKGNVEFFMRLVVGRHVVGGEHGQE